MAPPMDVGRCHFFVVSRSGDALPLISILVPDELEWGAGARHPQVPVVPAGVALELRLRGPMWFRAREALLRPTTVAV